MLDDAPTLLVSMFVFGGKFLFRLERKTLVPNRIFACSDLERKRKNLLIMASALHG